MAYYNYNFQVVIVGGGVTGAALAYVLARYTDIASIALLEKAGRPATVNSAASQNSQTLHGGDIETNYTLEKAAEVKRAAGMLVRYVEGVGEGGILHRMPKMVLGVGEQEVGFLRERFRHFQPLYPAMRLLDAVGIAEVEPEVARPEGKLRAEPLAALALPESYCAADFGRLTESFLRQAARLKPGLEVRFACRAKRIERSGQAYRISTDGVVINAGFVAVCAGAYSLGFAQNLGFGAALSILPIAGSFFHAPQRVRGKVYTVQSEKLPFAAVHADPDIEHPGRMRLGPTALPVPFLERRNWRTVPEFLRTLKLDGSTLATFASILGEQELRRYAVRNLLYEIPFLRGPLFLREARKILPALRALDLRYARGKGGLRPQLIDRQARALRLGSARIPSEEGLLFNITPSPGASSCLANAEEDARRIAACLGRKFNAEEMMHDLEATPT
jgi:malate dehydrogenase (quinone)